MSYRILIVEDDPLDSHLITKALQSAQPDAILDYAQDGEEALEHLSKAPLPSLIVLDLNMPRMDGQTFLVRVKSDDNLRKIPTLVLSTSDSKREIDECYKRHANAYLVKPDSLDGYNRIAGRVRDFWMEEVRLAV